MKKIKRKMRPAAKITIMLFVAGLAFWVVNTFVISGGVFDRGTKDGEVVINSNQTILPDAPLDQKGHNVQFAGIPSNQPANVNSTLINMKIMAWNSQMGLIFSNGGKRTTKGSLMEKNGVNLSIERLDDCMQMQAELISFAVEYKKNPTSATGTQFIAIMGDGAAAWLAGANEQLSRLGPDYTAEIIYSCGRSLGEDQFMAPPSVKMDPQNARGMTCATVIRDGDWNIVVKWASDNNIPINTDETTYNPQAINFIAASENTDASIKYNAGYTEEREEVKITPDGKTVKTGKRRTVGVDMISVWTPADVIAAEGKGGLVRIVSTKEYSAQMPNVVIGIKKWNSDHRTEVENLILAASQGGDQVKTFDESLNMAGQLSAQVYGEENGAYWVKYYKGAKVFDKVDANSVVELGGSRVNNLADNLELFGLGNNKVNTYASVYKVFGDIVASLYPEYVPTYPPISEVLNLTYIQNVAKRTGTFAGADETKYVSNNSEIKSVTSKRAWSIEFETGSAKFTQKTLKVMSDLHDQLVIAQGLQISIKGHTDATGSDDVNIPLSQKRAEAVKEWLQKLSPTNYPDNRFVQVVGRGSSEPIPGGTNSQNRRVEIVLGN